MTEARVSESKEARSGDGKDADVQELLIKVPVVLSSHDEQLVAQGRMLKSIRDIHRTNRDRD